MEELLYIVVGGALTMAGGFFQHLWAASREDKQWRRERSEGRLTDAASTIAGVWNLLESGGVMVAIHRPDDLSTRRKETVVEAMEAWEDLEPELRRIGVLNRELEGKVDEVVDAVTAMFADIAKTARNFEDGKAAEGSDLSESASEHRREALRHIRELADELAAL